jgi:catechol 2,3-dioxygenase-like lactoylglutathione lyase family enzyme
VDRILQQPERACTEDGVRHSIEILIGLLVLVAAVPCRAQGVEGGIEFTRSELVSSTAGDADEEAIVETIRESWERWLHLDAPGYLRTLARDVTRMSKRSGGLQQGVEAVAAALPAEWEAFERPKGIIAEAMRVRRAELWTDRPTSASVAVVVYWVSVVGGSRWRYDDQGLVFQALAKVGGRWSITHQIDSWSLNYNLGSRTPGAETFEFDFVYPAADLARAVNFYAGVLGEPESVTADRATFNLEGAHFILSTDLLDGLVGIDRGLPNGYAVFYVPDVAAERDRLAAAGTRFLAGTDTTVRMLGADRYVIGADPASNIFVLMERNFTASSTETPPEIVGFEGTDPYIDAARRIASSWLSADAEGLGAMLRPRSRWFDDTRTTVRGMETGRSAILSSLGSVYWPRYDRSPLGLQATLSVSGLRVRSLGKRTLVSYQAVLTGTGAHPFRTTAFVTQLFKDPSTLLHSFIVDSSSSTGMALELDYTGYPVTDLAANERFYTQTMQLGPPYRDTEYRGYWSDLEVFGIYTAVPRRDGLPRPYRANGYLSFWVRSAEETYRYLQRTGASFPVIPAINSVSGLDTNPGYVQVFGTDSEGSGVIFTEYTGRRR